MLAAVRDRAALDTDVTRLMAALPALVRAARYGDVRGTDPARLGEVAAEMITRICAGLPAAVASLDETAEQAMRERIDAVHAATGLLADGASRDRWLETLGRLAPAVPPADLRAADPAAARRGPDHRGRGGPADVPRAVRRGAPPRPPRAGPRASWPAAACCSCTTTTLLALADGWLAGLTADAFTAVLPGAAPDVRRVRAAGTAGDRAAGGPARRQRARARAATRTAATTSTRTGRRSRAGPWP